MVRNIIIDLCHHLEIGIDGNLDIGNKRVIVGTPTITLTDNILTINCNTAGASIYYTLDGSTPTSSSTKYTSAVTLNNSCTIKAIAIKGNKSSIVVSQDYIAILSAWKIVGNSEVHGNEIWSCGEYSSIDGKYHILVQPLGGSIADIALDEPLRKVNDVADNIEFADGTAVVTRYLNSVNLGNMNYTQLKTRTTDVYRFGFTPALIAPSLSAKDSSNLLSYKYSVSNTFLCRIGVNTSATGTIFIYDDKYDKDGDATNLKNSLQGVELIYELATPTTDTIQVPQIQDADSYSCVISQGGKAVSWSSFIPNLS